eukprot:3918509-Pyramimonas_sp.AAC.1
MRRWMVWGLRRVIGRCALKAAGARTLALAAYHSRPLPGAGRRQPAPWQTPFSTPLSASPSQ